MFSIRVKELFEPIVLRKQGDTFLLFSKAFSGETDLSVTLGDFTVKMQNWEEKSVLTENQCSRKELWCAADNYNNMCHICERTFKIRTLTKQLFTKHQILTKLQQISNIHKDDNFKYNWNFLDQLLLPYKFHGRDM